MDKKVRMEILRITGRLPPEIHIPDGVKELYVACFADCEKLSRVTFSESSSLWLIGKGAFRGSGVCEIRAPDGVKEYLRNVVPSSVRIAKP